MPWKYISGGSNVPEIKAFFWKWRRAHHPHTETNLDRFGANMSLPNQQPMQNLGVFGEMVASEMDGLKKQDEKGGGVGGFGGHKPGAPMAARGGSEPQSKRPGWRE